MLSRLSARRALSSRVLIAAAIFGATTAGASAQTYTWNLNATGTWDTTTANWLVNGGPGTYVNGTASQAYFGNVISASRTITVGAGTVAGGVTFDVPSFNGYTLSTNTLTLNSGGTNDVVTVQPYAAGTQTISAPLTFTNNLVLNNNASPWNPTGSLTLSGAIGRASNGGSITVNGLSGTTISGAIGSSVTGGIVKNSGGNLVLSSFSNAFGGNVVVNAGTVSFGSDSNIPSSAQLVYAAGGSGAFRLTSTGTSRTFDFQGNGILLGGTSTTAISSTVFSNSTGRTLTLLSDNTSNTQRMQFTVATNFAGSIVVGGNSQFVGNMPALQRPIWAGSGLNSSVNFRVSSATVANFPSVAAITVNPTTAITISQPGGTSASVTGRINPSAPLTFNSGRFSYGIESSTALSGAGNTTIAETFGATTMTGLTTFNGLNNGSDGALAVNQLGTGTATNAVRAGPTGGTGLNFGALTRTDNATLMFRLATSVNGQVGGTPSASTVNYKFSNLTADTTSSGVTRSVLPWSSYSLFTSASPDDPQGFITYDTNGFRPLVLNTETQSRSESNFNAATSGANVQLSPILGTNNGTVASGGQTINSLFVQSGGGGVTATSASDVLTVTSGAFATFSTMRFVNVSLNLPNGGFFHHGSSSFTVSGTSQITGSGGVVVSAFNSGIDTGLIFSNTNANTFTGGLFLNGNGQVYFTDNNQLGASTGDTSADANTVVLQGGGLHANATVDSDLSTGGVARNIRIGASNGVLGNRQTATTLTVPGLISGSGQLIINRSSFSAPGGVVKFTNPVANTYAGGTLLAGGTLAISREDQLGTGEVIFAGGTLRADAAMTLSKTYTVAADQKPSTAAYGFNAANDITFAGALRGDQLRTLTKSGNGALIITTDNPNFGGIIAVTAGKLQLGNGSTAGNANTYSVTLATGTILEVNRSNAITFGAVISSAGQLVKNGGGVLSLTAANTYTGGTTVNAGTLLAMNGVSTTSAVGTAAVTVNGSATLGGTGYISPAVNINAGGTLAPGASVGTLTVNSNVSFNSGTSLSTFAIEIGPIGPSSTTASDRLVVGGTTSNLTLGASASTSNVNLAVSILPGSTLSFGQVYWIVNNTSTGTTTGLLGDAGTPILDDGLINLGGGLFAVVSYNGDFGTSSGRFADSTTPGNDIALQVVPEPATLSTLAGLALMTLARRRRA
jgi:fibronectin-binding autotransporter adhesin